MNPDNTPADVPSPIDWGRMQDALEWERSAMIKRPWRTAFFEQFAAQIENAAPKITRVLELGSGPGFLARHLLQQLRLEEYVLLDFSAAMHILAKERLGALAQHARFVERDLKLPSWPEDLGSFDCILTNQAVHELRHKRYAPVLHAQVREILRPSGRYLLCDHFNGDGGMSNDQLYMTAQEQRSALEQGGFRSVEVVLVKGGLILHRAQ